MPKLNCSIDPPKDPEKQFAGSEAVQSKIKIKVLLVVECLKFKLTCVCVCACEFTCEFELQVALLEIQQSERMDTSFDRGCLFCPQTPKGNRAVLFTHMLEEHGFSVGLPDNLGE